MSEQLSYWRTVDEDGKQRTHLEGPGDSYTLCGHDTAGDTATHSKPPVCLGTAKRRITCKHCLQFIAFVRLYLKP